VDEDTPYIVMELLEGEDLGEFLNREGTLGAKEALEILHEAGLGLLEAHRVGLVHRDIKPANLFLAKNGETRVVKLLDFGITKEAKQSGNETTTGMVFGSPAYMSPEQARGGSVDARSDLWAMGALLYKMLLGEPPFSGANPSDIVVKLCTEAPRQPSEMLGRPAQSLDQFFKKALSKDPTRRFLDVNDFLAGAREALSDLPTGQRRPARVEPRGRSDETAPLEPSGARSPSSSEPSTISAQHDDVTQSARRRRSALWALLGVVSVSALLAYAFLVQGSDEPSGGSAAPLLSTKILDSGVSAKRPPRLKSEGETSPEGGGPKESAALLREPGPPVQDSSPSPTPRPVQKSAVRKPKKSTPPQQKEEPDEGSAAPSTTDPVFGLPLGRKP
jgi:serine/threonine-protein kinase